MMPFVSLCSPQVGFAICLEVEFLVALAVDWTDYTFHLGAESDADYID